MKARFLFLILILIMAVGCASKNSDTPPLPLEPVEYENLDLSFSLILPPIWDYNYQDRDSAGEGFVGSTVSFLFAPDNILIEPLTPVFSIHVMDQKVWLNLPAAKRTQLGDLFATNGNIVYTVQYPQKIPLVTGSPQLKLFQQMLLDPSSLSAAFSAIPRNVAAFERSDLGFRLELPPVWQNNYTVHAGSLEKDAHVTRLRLVWAPQGKERAPQYDLINIYIMSRSHYNNLEFKNRLPNGFLLGKTHTTAYIGATFFDLPAEQALPNADVSDINLWTTLALNESQLLRAFGYTEVAHP